MGRRARAESPLDLELEDLPPEMRWREWMGRVEAVIFASPAPVTREVLARLVGKTCNLELIIEDIREELRGRPYELVVAGGWRHQTRKNFAEANRAATGLADQVTELSRAEAGVLMAIAYFQPVTRGEISEMFAREISRDLIASLRGAGLIAAGPRSPQPGAPYAYVTTPGFLGEFGFESLRDLPDIEKLEDAGLLGASNSDGRNTTEELDEDRPAALLSDQMRSRDAADREDDWEEDAAEGC
jgi:segregation and condensation protein B